MAGVPRLMDGGMASSPQSGFWNPNGTWDVENYGVAPDIEVEMEPAAVRAGHDPQLEKTVQPDPNHTVLHIQTASTAGWGGCRSSCTIRYTLLGRELAANVTFQ